MRGDRDESGEASGDDRLLEAFSGIPMAVEPDRIEKELASLWKPAEAHQDGTPSVTRACLSNVVVHAGSRRALDASRPILQGVMRRFPSRLILVADQVDAAPACKEADGSKGAAAKVVKSEPALAKGAAADAGEEGGAGIEAFISAVCQVPQPGAIPTCCEQIILEGRGAAPEVQGSLITSLLVPDIPVILLRLDAGGDGLQAALESALDAVVFDSRALSPSALSRPMELLSRVHNATVDDLAWKDIQGWRRLLADVFDDPPARGILLSAERIEVRHAAGSSTRSALLGGWLASRLGGARSVALREEPAGFLRSGELSSLRLEGACEAYLQLRRLEDGRGVLLEVRSSRLCLLPRCLALPRTREGDLLGLAMEQAAAQEVFHDALRAVRRLGLGA